MPKFHIGDRVRLTHPALHPGFLQADDIGTVSEITERGYNVIFDNHTVVRRLGDDDLELTEAHPEQHDHL